MVVVGWTGSAVAVSPVGRQTDVGRAVAHQPQDQRYQQQQVTDIALGAMVGAEILGN